MPFRRVTASTLHPEPRCEPPRVNGCHSGKTLTGFVKGLAKHEGLAAQQLARGQGLPWAWRGWPEELLAGVLGS